MSNLHEEKPSLDSLVSTSSFEIVEDDFVEHFGTKGMKWGVRKEARLQTLNRVASGQGTTADRANVKLTQVSGKSVHKSGSLEKAAANKAAELQGRKDRIQSGNGTLKDRIALAGGDRLYENSGARAANAEKRAAKGEAKAAKILQKAGSTKHAELVASRPAASATPKQKSDHSKAKTALKVGGVTSAAVLASVGATVVTLVRAVDASKPTVFQATKAVANPKNWG